MFRREDIHGVYYEVLSPINHLQLLRLFYRPRGGSAIRVEGDTVVIEAGYEAPVAHIDLVTYRLGYVLEKLDTSIVFHPINPVLVSTNVLQGIHFTVEGLVVKNVTRRVEGVTTKYIIELNKPASSLRLEVYSLYTGGRLAVLHGEGSNKYVELVTRDNTIELTIRDNTVYTVLAINNEKLTLYPYFARVIVEKDGVWIREARCYRTGCRFTKKALPGIPFWFTVEVIPRVSSTLLKHIDRIERFYIERLAVESILSGKKLYGKQYVTIDRASVRNRKIAVPVSITVYNDEKLVVVADGVRSREYTLEVEKIVAPAPPKPPRPPSPPLLPPPRPSPPPSPPGHYIHPAHEFLERLAGLIGATTPIHMLLWIIASGG